MDLTPTRPYLIRAFYDWILDNDLTPYILVDATFDGVQVPQDFISEGKIVLNLTPSAIKGLDLGNEWIAFSARFAGKAMEIFIPVLSVTAIYAQENGRGMVFHDEENPTPPSPPPEGTDKRDEPPASKKPQLRVVK